MPFKILVIDDNIHDPTDTISELPALLESAGYEVAVTADGESAYDLVFKYRPDCIVLDIHFDRQDVSGIEICRALRADDYRAPIILITAVYTETADVLEGFDAGADDYVRKRCDNREIRARIRANLPPDQAEFDGRLRMDFAEQRLWVDGKEVYLQPLLFKLLHVLAGNAGRITASTRLKDQVWEKDISDDALAVFIRRLRDRVEPDPHHPTCIETVRGVGYRFNGRPGRSSREMPARRIPC